MMQLLFITMRKCGYVLVRETFLLNRGQLHGGDEGSEGVAAWEKRGGTGDVSAPRLLRRAPYYKRDVLDSAQVCFKLRSRP